MQFINAIEMIHLVRFVICTALHIPDRIVLFSSPAANHRYTIFFSVIPDVNCFHIFGLETIAMLLFKLWFTLNTYNSDLDKFHEILHFSINLSILLLAWKVVIWPPGFVLHLISHTVPHSTAAWEFCVVNLQESVLLQRKDFNLLRNLDPCDYYKLQLMKLKE